jgi:hypothetical protein
MVTVGAGVAGIVGVTDVVDDPPPPPPQPAIEANNAMKAITVFWFISTPLLDKHFFTARESYLK